MLQLLFRMVAQLLLCLCLLQLLLYGDSSVARSLFVARTILYGVSVVVGS